jgi:hypothetical protein
MLLVTKKFEQFMGTPFEDFTSKMMIASTFPVIVPNFDDDDIKALEWIRANTHKDVMVSLWKLDRAVNKGKKHFVNQTENKRRYIRNDAKTRELRDLPTNVELEEDQIQYYLCEAILQIERIIHRNLLNYNEDFQMPIQEANEESEEDMLGITKT